MDLLTYLKHYEPQELVHLYGGTYCTREHDSLKISNGKWHWWSRGFGGVSALDYLIKVKGYPFIQAVEVILGRAASLPPVSRAPPQKEPRKLLLPEQNETTHQVKQYLMGRGIHPSIIDYCLAQRILFESKQYHNAVFIGYDQEGNARYAALRGTMGSFKGEAGKRGADDTHRPTPAQAAPEKQTPDIPRSTGLAGPNQRPACP